MLLCLLVNVRVERVEVNEQIDSDVIAISDSEKEEGFPAEARTGATIDRGREKDGLSFPRDPSIFCVLGLSCVVTVSLNSIAELYVEC